jgi:hypothetical protein
MTGLLLKQEKSNINIQINLHLFYVEAFYQSHV